MRRETEASQDCQDSKAYLDHLVLRDHQAPEEIQEALGILGNQDHVEIQEAWGSWECQVLRERRELWAPLV